jgi:hypothetical protein
MIERAHWSAAARGAIATCCLLGAGCAGVKHAKTAERVPTPVPAEASVVAEGPTAKAGPEGVPEAATIPRPTVSAPANVVSPETRETATPPPVVEPVHPAPTVAPAPRVEATERPASTPSPAPKVAAPRPPGVAAVPVPPTVPQATNVPVPRLMPKAAPSPVASQSAPAPLDLASLATRLKQTRAIGVLTKLSLRNQVDDLLEKFRAYHSQQGRATLPELRRSYDMLMLKVLALLQDSDPPLARDIVQSRAAIWGILADPRKFEEASLMAGATT